MTHSAIAKSYFIHTRKTGSAYSTFYIFFYYIRAFLCSFQVSLLSCQFKHKDITERIKVNNLIKCSLFLFGKAARKVCDPTWKKPILPLCTAQMTVKGSGVIFSSQIFLWHNLIPLLIENKPVHRGLPSKMKDFSFNGKMHAKSMWLWYLCFH